MIHFVCPCPDGSLPHVNPLRNGDSLVARARFCEGTVLFSGLTTPPQAPLCFTTMMGLASAADMAWDYPPWGFWVWETCGASNTSRAQFCRTFRLNTDRSLAKKVLPNDNLRCQ